METNDRVLIATDGSEDATYAVRKGIEQAKLNKASHVIVLYVKDLIYLSDMPEDDVTLLISTGLQKEGELILEGVKRIASDIGFPVETLIMEGHPADVILDIAIDRNIDTIILGKIGRSGIPKLLMGSVAENVSRHAQCHVTLFKSRPADE